MNPFRIQMQEHPACHCCIGKLVYDLADVAHAMGGKLSKHNEYRRANLTFGLYKVRASSLIFGLWTEIGRNISYLFSSLGFQTHSPRMKTRAHATLLIGLALVSFVLPRAQTISLEAAQPAPSNRAPRLVVAVLPFKNATGDGSLEHWSDGFDDLLAGRLAWAQRVHVRGWSDVRSALTNAGWAPGQPGDAKLASQVASQLEVDAILWGEYSRPGGEWTLRFWIWQRRATNQLATLELKDAALSDLLIRAPLELAERLGAKVPPDMPDKWRRRGTGSNSAWDKFAQVISLERTNGPPSEREKILRKLVTEQPQFLAAQASLAELLMRTERISESEVEYRKLTNSAPDWCFPHFMLANFAHRAERKAEAERELNECFRVHPGCPTAVEGFFQMLHDADRWKELRDIFEKANADRPDETSTLAYLAATRVRCGDGEGGERLLRELGDATWESINVHLAILEAALEAKLLEQFGTQIRWLQNHAATDPNAAQHLSEIDASFFITNAIPMEKRPVRPRSYTPAELTKELEQRLTAEERALAINPVEITPELSAFSKNLTRGLTNPALRAVLLFGEVTRRGRGSGEGGIRTAQQSLQSSQDPQVGFSCQEFAKLFVASARAAGLAAWLAHIDVDEEGRTAFHDCATLFLGEQSFLVDPTWGAFIIDHRQFRVLDDLQAIAHQAMQPGETPNLDRKRLGRKLDPDDAWTGLRWVCGLAEAGFTEKAETELSRLGTNQTARWDYYLASAAIEVSARRWQLALAALEQALLLSPSNPVVHLQLSHVYNNLEQYGKSREHAEAAARLDPGNSYGLKSHQSRFGVELLGALAQAQSRKPGSRDDLKRRAQKGEAAAQFGLAKLLLESEPPEIPEAMEWLRKAAEQGDDEIQQVYARNLLSLNGPAGAEEALHWYSRSAKQGNSEAQLRLGILLYDGKLATRDVVTACQWVILAAGQGQKEARFLLQEMELFLEKSQMAEARKRAAEFKPQQGNGTP